MAEQDKSRLHKIFSKNQRKRTTEGEEKVNKVVKFYVGNYVFLQYPNRPPNKLADNYRGPFIIVAIERPDVITVKD